MARPVSGPPAQIISMMQTAEPWHGYDTAIRILEPAPTCHRSRLCSPAHFFLACLCYHKDDCSSCRPTGCFHALRGQAHRRPEPNPKENPLCL